MNFNKGKLPNFDGSIVLTFPKSVLSSQITSLFGKDTDIQVFDDILEMTYIEVKNLYCWEVNDLLKKLFHHCDFEILLLAQKQLGAKIIIDVSFHHYHKYPSLIFEGVNMENIHMLKADISIDAY